MLVTADARVNVWDMQKLEIVMKEVSFAHLLCDNRKRLQNCSLTKIGTPLLTISDSTFLYYQEMGVWIEACSPGEHTEVEGVSTTVDSTSSEIAPLQRLQTSTLSGSEDMSNTLTRLRDCNAKLATAAFLESQVSCSSVLKSPFEYQHWTKAYVKYLVKEGMELRLREFCMRQWCWGFRDKKC